MKSFVFSSSFKVSHINRAVRFNRFINGAFLKCHINIAFAVYRRGLTCISLLIICHNADEDLISVMVRSDGVVCLFSLFILRRFFAILSLYGFEVTLSLVSRCSKNRSSFTYLFTYLVVWGISTK